jgi:hypothetical protein
VPAGEVQQHRGGCRRCRRRWSCRALPLEPSATLGAVARQVGCGSAFALSVAGKRVRGVSPQAFREQSHL